MMKIGAVGAGILLSGTLYGVSKTFNYFSTLPEGKVHQVGINRLRISFSKWCDDRERKSKDWPWHVRTLENVWVMTLIMTFSKRFPLFGPWTNGTVLFLYIGSMVFAFVREGAVRNFPRLSPLLSFNADITERLNGIRDLKRILRIPSRFRNDAILSRYKCPIELEPVRSPILDSSNRMTVYESGPYHKWWFKNPTSPMTRAPVVLLFPEALRNIIDHRLKWLLSREIERIENGESLPTGDETLDRLEPILKVTPEYLNEVNEVRNAQSIEEFEEIPKLFENDYFLSICPISQKPIRNPYFLPGSVGLERIVYYEKREILEWMEQEPSKRPPGWPETIEYKKENVKGCSFKKESIEQYLKVLLEELKQLNLNLEMMEQT